MLIKINIALNAALLFLFLDSCRGKSIHRSPHNERNDNEENIRLISTVLLKFFNIREI